MLSLSISYLKPFLHFCLINWYMTNCKDQDNSHPYLEYFRSETVHINQNRCTDFPVTRTKQHRLKGRKVFRVLLLPTLRVLVLIIVQLSLIFWETQNCKMVVQTIVLWNVSHQTQTTELYLTHLHLTGDCTFQRLLKTYVRVLNHHPCVSWHGPYWFH